MSAGSTSAALLAAGALALAGCPTHEPKPKPFHTRITLISTGDPLGEGFTAETIVDITGSASWEGAQSLVVRDASVTDLGAVGDVRITFDARGLPEAAFPAGVDGKAVRVKARISPEGAGPNLEPMPVPGIRVLVTDAGAERSVFLLWEGTYVRERVARVLSPAQPTIGEFIDFPLYAVEEQWAEVEAGECGLAYYDRLNVGDGGAGASSVVVLAVLGRGEQDRAVQLTQDPEPWTVAHVLSYHRDGTCEGQARAFTQLAAWRTPFTE